MSEEKEVQLVKINAAEFGLKAENVEGVEQAFMPAINDRNILEGEYKKIVAMDISDPQTGTQARAIRLKLVKVRTSIAAIHKSQKAFFLASGKFVDAWKNKETEPVTQMEERLTEIEKHFENIEKERLAALLQKRTEQLMKYADNVPTGLAGMDAETFDYLLSGAKARHQEKIEAEAKAKAEAEAKAKAEKEEKERLEKEAEAEREKQRLENERLQKELAEQQEKERLAQVERDRLAKIEQDKRDKIEADRKKKDAAEKLELENERRETERLHAIELKRQKAVQDKIDKALREAHERSEKLEREKNLADAKKLDEENAAKARAADVENRAAKNNAAKECFIALGMTEELAIMAVKAIAKGSIQNVSINY